MISILNCGGDQAEEFFASARRSSLFSNARRPTFAVSYAPSGRVFIDGQPQRKTTAEQMWDELLKLFSTNSALQNALLLPALSHISRSDGEIFKKIRFAKRQHTVKCAAEMASDEFLVTTDEGFEGSKSALQSAEQDELKGGGALP
ncbi:hypothetical protein Tcan_15252 [Toxocara canis]|uniref:Uncharacterized protein n=2 Tax=Toxocara canis TaxID=6265 RepID=A0A0B2VL98_TOXCA|nr:hypothetical protein Tcan_15252 [Toxocara canis]VDM23944.1 unnamed protein product [Toxocara canis]